MHDADQQRTTPPERLPEQPPEQMAEQPPQQMADHVAEHTEQMADQMA